MGVVTTDHVSIEEELKEHSNIMEPLNQVAHSLNTLVPHGQDDTVKVQEPKKRLNNNQSNYVEGAAVSEPFDASGHSFKF
jgi:hypothetical protein